MSLCAPTIVGPLSELNRTIRVQGQLTGATVTITSLGPNQRMVATGVAGSGDAFIDLIPTEMLSRDDLLVAVQELGGERSRAVRAEAMGVQPAPQTAAEIGFVGYETHLYECGEALWVSGATPGARVETTFGGAVHGGGLAFDGSARFGLAARLPSGPVASHQIIPTLPPGPDTTRTPDAIPTASGDLLPAPTIYPPLKACQPSVLIGDVFDGANVTLKRSSEPNPIQAVFDRSALWFILSKPLVDGEKITVTQSFDKCERRGKESSPPAKVDPAAPIEIPSIDGKLCAGATRIPVIGLIPGAKVQILVGPKTYNGQTPPGVTSHTFDIGDPLPAPPPDLTVSVKQERCDLFGNASSPGVPIDPHEVVTTGPAIVPPLLACARAVFVRDVHPNALLQVVSKKRGNTPISNLVTMNATSGSISVSPYLTKDDDITVSQRACGGAWVNSAPEHVRPHPPLDPPKPSGLSGPIVSGDTAVRISGAVPGASIEVTIDVLERPTFIGSGVASPAPLETILYLSRVLHTGDKVRAQQFLCADQSARTDPPVTVVVPRPLQPVLTAPAANAANVVKRPTLSWNDPGASQERKATSFQVEIRQGATTVLPPTTLNTTSYLLPFDLATSSKFTWLVTSINSTGSSSQASADFTTVAPPPPPPGSGGSAPTKPTINSVTNQGAGKFQVKGNGFLKSHAVHIRVVNDATFASDFFQSTSDSSGNIDATISIAGFAGGVTLDFSANDERPDPGDLTGTLWSTTFKLST